jgi:predicted PurR-regulated permease PerM
MNKTYYFNLQRIAHLLIILSLSVYIAVIGQAILAPLAFAVMFSFLLLPICQRLERWIRFRPISILLSMFIATIPIIFIFTIFSYQMVTVVGEMPSIGNQLRNGLDKILALIQPYFDAVGWLENNLGSLLEAPLNALSSGISSSTNMFVSILFCILVTFFLMLYRTSFKNFLIIQFSPESRMNARRMMQEIQQIIQEYLYGLLLVILILCLLNSLGLWIIGIKYPAFWGVMAALLAVIPYIGTTLGGTLPFIYALATTGTVWQPAAVVALYAFIQTIEGNYITPKVIGGSVSINPLTALICLFLGGLIWGVAGLVLALPVIAVLKVIFSYITPLKPISELFSTGLYRNSDKFLREYDDERFRLANYFKQKKPEQ